MLSISLQPFTLMSVIINMSVGSVLILNNKQSWGDPGLGCTSEAQIPTFFGDKFPELAKLEQSPCRFI